MNNKFLSIKGLETLLGKLKEKFVVKNELSDVATSGSYNDLTDKPTIPSEVEIPIATTNEAGIVKPSNGLSVDENGNLTVNVGDGLNMNNNQLSVNVAENNELGIIKPSDGLIVDENGSLSIDVDTNSGLFIDNNTKKLSLNFDGVRWNSAVRIESDNWVRLYAKLIEVASNCKNVNKKYMNVTLVNINYNVTIDKVLNIQLTNEIIENIYPTDNIKNYVDTILNNIQINVENELNIEHCCDSLEEIICYEYLKLLSTKDYVDAVELYFYKDLINKQMTPSAMIASVGKIIPDVVKVFDFNISRFNKCGFIGPQNTNILSTYILKEVDEGGYPIKTYFQLEPLIQINQ